MDESGGELRKDTRKRDLHLGRTRNIERFGFADEWRNPVDLSSLSYFFLDKSVDLDSLVFSDHSSVYRFSACWILIEY